MNFVDRLVKELERENVGLAMSVMQRFGIECSREVFENLHFSEENVRVVKAVQGKL